MRILFVNSVRRTGGGVSSAVTLARGLAQSGHAVTLACNANGELRRRLLDDAALALAPIRFGPDVDPLAAFALARAIRRTGAEVALADRRKDVKLLLTARLFGARVPIVHRNGAPSVMRETRLYRFLWRRIHSMVVNSHAMHHRLLESSPWLAAVPITVVHNAVDTDRFRPRPERRMRVREELGIPADAFVIAFHGIFQPRKRLGLLMSAVARLPASLRARVLLIGAGPERAALEQHAKALGVLATFTGLRTDVPELLAACDVAAHLSSAEGLSNTVLEDLACGLPVVATDEHSHPEQIDDGVTGFLVPPDETAVADALLMLAEPGRRAMMAPAARETAETQFTVETMVQGYVDVLEKAKMDPNVALRAE